MLHALGSARVWKRVGQAKALVSASGQGVPSEARKRGKIWRELDEKKRKSVS